MPRTTSSGRSRLAPELGEAKAQHDDPDVFDAVVGEEALQVVLADREGHAEDARGHAQASKRAPHQRRGVRQEEAVKRNRP